MDRALYGSQGHPFVVNALAYHVTRERPVAPPQPIDGDDIERAASHLVATGTTHLSTFDRRIDHPYFAKVLCRVLVGDAARELGEPRANLDDCVDFGLLRRTDNGYASPNPLYREVLVRTLTRAYDTLPGYLDTLGLADGWLLIFDQRAGRSWEERLWSATVERGGKRLFLRGGEGLARQRRMPRVAAFRAGHRRSSVRRRTRAPLTPTSPGATIGARREP